MNQVHSEKYKGYEILILQDEDPQAPNEGDVEDLFLVFDHRDFCVKVPGYEPQDLFNDVYAKNKRFYNGYWLIPIEAYIHSGVHLMIKGSVEAANCPDRRWDVSFKGFVLVKRIKQWSFTYETATKRAAELVKSWNNYNSGNVYGYEIPELDSSCWGFYGDWEDHAMVEAKHVIDHHLKPKAYVKSVRTV